MILSKVYEDAENRLERNEITLGEFERLVDIEVIEPKQGKWIDTEIRHEDGVLPIQVCSECKTFYPLEYTGGGHRFCPNCGAKMTDRKTEQTEREGECGG